MIISCPDKFFVPIILLKNYREVLDIEINNGDFSDLLRNKNYKEFNNISRNLLEDKILTYNVNELQNVSREALEDKTPNIKEIESEIYEDITNIDDKNLEYYILKYVTAFMIYKNELEAEGCADINNEEYLKNIKLYVEALKNLNNEFLELKKKITIPLTLEEQEAIENYFIKKIEEIYNNQFSSIKCEEKKNVIDNNIPEIIEETRELLKREIKKINEEIFNMKKNKVTKDEEYFKHLKEIYDEIEKENQKDL